ncbi:MAG: nitroreductase family protein [Alphaproteobacteria bacterium]
MNAEELLKTRRSVRKYKNQKVNRGLMEEVIELTKWAPSWANFQIARYTLIDDEALIKRIAQEGVHGFAYNIKTLDNAKGVAILSFVKGKSGKLNATDYATAQENSWEIFDAGIACQQFCLAAHAKGIGTCIFGVIDSAVLADIANLPETETVAAVITYGYPDEDPIPTPRKDLSEIMKFL